MPKKSDAPAEPKAAKVDDKLEVFCFPTIGPGVSIRARSQDEANSIAEKVKADFAANS
ncbi:MAG: hypothetical protein AB7O68_16835 [Pirellulales bacterium]